MFKQLITQAAVSPVERTAAGVLAAIPCDGDGVDVAAVVVEEEVPEGPEVAFDVGSETWSAASLARPCTPP